MLVNRRQGAIYTGVTAHLIQRIWQHKQGVFKGWAKDNGCQYLAWFEQHDLISAAIAREKSIKSYRRQNKINLIEAANPHWKDLWFQITG
jgi:putative endonuclease